MFTELSRSQYALLDGALYKLEKDNSLRIFVPECDHEELFKEAHEGVFGGHLREAKIYSPLPFCHHLVTPHLPHI